MKLFTTAVPVTETSTAVSESETSVENDSELTFILSAEDSLEKYDRLQQWVGRKDLFADKINIIEKELDEKSKLDDVEYADFLLHKLNDVKNMLDLGDASRFEDNLESLIDSVNGKKNEGVLFECDTLRTGFGQRYCTSACCRKSFRRIDEGGSIPLL